MKGEPRGGRTIVITGASAGVGRAAAHRFARAGARIGLIARDAGALEDVKREVEARGGRALVAAADVADADAVFGAKEQIRQAFGPIDVWINDAMVTVFAPTWEITPKEFRRVTEVTYLGYVHGTLAALADMRPRDRGVIIQVGSALAYRAIPLQAAYCGAKHAIRGFTDALRAELIHDASNVAISMIELPAVNTPQFDWARTRLPREVRPVGPVVQPEVIANAIYRASLDPKREYWIGRSTLEVILGNMALPALFDRLLARRAYEGQMTRVPALPHQRDNLDEPVHDLHRTRGSFGREASRHALLLPGTVARAGAAALTATLMLLAGAGAARLLGEARAPRRRLHRHSAN